MPPLTNVQLTDQQIKNLENMGQITLPEPQATVTVGSIHASIGKFEWSVKMGPAVLGMGVFTIPYAEKGSSVLQGVLDIAQGLGQLAERAGG